MFRDMMGGLQFIAKPGNLRNMRADTPVLFLSGEQDPVGGMGRGVRKVRQMFLDAGCTDVTLKLYPGGRHEMFHEVSQQEVFEDLLAWLEDKLPHFGYNVSEAIRRGFCDLSGSSGRRTHLQRPQLQGLSGVQRARLRQHHARPRRQGHRHRGHPQL